MSVNIVRCSGAKPHFFDGDKYGECPVCGAKPAAGGDSASSYAQPEKEKVLNSVKPQKKPDKKDGKPWWERKKEERNKANGGAREPEKTETLMANDSRTVGMEYYGKNLSDESVSDSTPSQKPSGSPSREISHKPAPDMFGNSGYNVPLENRQLHNASASNIADDDGKTVGIYKNVYTEPVVGWLVCIKGESIGESYSLKTGKNSIGRGVDMDVMLANESSVSRNRHAVLTFEPKKRRFLLQPGDGNGMVYLNDELLLEFREIESRDIIQLGEALFMFYPFCGEDFTWDDYIEK